MDRLSDISRPDFDPTDEDCLRTRVKTTGIHEETIKIGEYTYTVIDVGGQRSERKKWINCFSNVSGIFFVIGASEYDQVIIEDGKTVTIIKSEPYG
jgi:guanine nucleotide-binding protein subunit alpha